MIQARDVPFYKRSHCTNARDSLQETKRLRLAGLMLMVASDGPEISRLCPTSELEEIALLLIAVTCAQRHTIEQIERPRFGLRTIRITSFNAEECVRQFRYDGVRHIH